MTEIQATAPKETLFTKAFKNLEDPRRTDKGNLLYPIEEVLFLVISASVCGANTWTAIELFGKKQLNWLRRYFPYLEGTPSHDVLGNIFSALDPDQFGKCFIEWSSSISAQTKGEVVAIDGKCMRGSYDTATSKMPIHIVSAFASKNGICLGQKQTNAKSNEITAIPELLDLLALQGCIVTIDAMGCQKKITDKIISKGADFIIAIKENQGELLEQAKKMFSIGTPPKYDESIDAGHGRVETRRCYVTDDLRFFDIKKEWGNVKSIAKVESERFIKVSGKNSKETRYYITSLPADAAKINKSVRAHWSVENKLHWNLDVIFGEDLSRKRKGNSAANFNMASKIALGLLEKENSKGLTKPNKRLYAAIDNDYRAKVLGF